MIIYIAGPYTHPDPCENTHNALLLADKLLEMGHTPIVPHLSHFWHTMTPKPYDVWLAYAMELMKLADAVFRMPGFSPGADQETYTARELGKVIYLSIEELSNGCIL